jgi:hypothetical protein
MTTYRTLALGLAVSLLGVAALTSVGCGNAYGDYCRAERDCEGLNDADQNACVEYASAQERVASHYGCSKQFAELRDCMIAESSCEGVGDNKAYTTYDFDNGRDKCETELDNYGDCVDGSSLADD